MSTLTVPPPQYATLAPSRWGWSSVPSSTGSKRYRCTIIIATFLGIRSGLRSLLLGMGHSVSGWGGVRFFWLQHPIPAALLKLLQIFEMSVTYYGQPEHITNPPTLSEGVFIFETLAAALIFGFFCVRIKRLSGNWILGALCYAFCLVPVALTIFIMVLAVRDGLSGEYRQPGNALLDALAISRGVWAAAYFHIETTILTCLITIGELIMFVSRARTQNDNSDVLMGEISVAWMAFYVVHPKVFSNTMLATLNNRQRPDVDVTISYDHQLEFRITSSGNETQTRTDCWSSSPKKWKVTLERMEGRADNAEGPGGPNRILNHGADRLSEAGEAQGYQQAGNNNNDGFTSCKFRKYQNEYQRFLRANFRTPEGQQQLLWKGLPVEIELLSLCPLLNGLVQAPTLMEYNRCILGLSANASIYEKRESRTSHDFSAVDSGVFRLSSKADRAEIRIGTAAPTPEAASDLPNFWVENVYTKRIMYFNSRKGFGFESHFLRRVFGSIRSGFFQNLGSQMCWIRKPLLEKGIWVNPIRILSKSGMPKIRKPLLEKGIWVNPIRIHSKSGIPNVYTERIMYFNLRKGVGFESHFLRRVFGSI
ncbi:hypothetical protein K438DRAFT_1769573 [Mycena galopus ATCC 62051]|nr:hypothetical protein K438DRAFT_1769573 [Mycena galopus ATCC 62051]